MQLAFKDPAVKALFDAYPAAVRRPLLGLRSNIFAVAAETEGVGELVEALKWRQPSYLPAQPKIGSTIRIDALKGERAGYAMFFHCQTTLVANFRQIYPDTFAFDGNRAICFAIGRPVDGRALRHCIALALTYHVRRNAKS